MKLAFEFSPHDYIYCLEEEVKTTCNLRANISARPTRRLDHLAKTQVWNLLRARATNWWSAISRESPPRKEKVMICPTLTQNSRDYQAKKTARIC